MSFKAAHPYFATGLIILLLVAMFFASCQLLASGYQALVLKTNLLRPSATALQGSRLATRLDPGNIDYLRLQAYLEESRNGPDAALRVFHDSLAASPAWPHTWAAIARHRARHGHYNERMRIALARSQALGPHERSVQFTNAVVGIDHWYRLTPALRTQVEPSILFALTHETTRTMHAYIGATGRGRLYCRRFAEAAGGRQWCEKYNLPLGPG